MAAQSTTPLLKVEGLKQYFRVNKNFTVKAVDDVSFEIYPGETYGLARANPPSAAASSACTTPLRARSPLTGRISAAV